MAESERMRVGKCAMKVVSSAVLGGFEGADAGRLVPVLGPLVGGGMGAAAGVLSALSSDACRCQSDTDVSSSQRSLLGSDQRSLLGSDQRSLLGSDQRSLLGSDQRSLLGSDETVIYHGVSTGRTVEFTCDANTSQTLVLESDAGQRIVRNFEPGEKVVFDFDPGVTVAVRLAR
jgi:hypothetical protein